MNVYTQKAQILGVTLRIGRFFKGSAGIIEDLLFRAVGDPGETTVVPHRKMPVFRCRARDIIKGKIFYKLQKPRALVVWPTAPTLGNYASDT